MTTAAPTTVPPVNMPSGAPHDDAHRARTGRRTRNILLLLPVTLLLFFTFILPMAWLLRMSLNTGAGFGIIKEGFSFDSYAVFFSNSFYIGEILNTVVLGVIVTLACLVLGYPIGLFLLRSTSRFKSALLALAIAPLLTSAVVRTFGWMTILGDDGLINKTLMSIHLIETPLRLANNQLGAYIALTEILMPYMILAVFTGSSRLNPTLEEAAATLGGSSIRRFLTVTFPLTLPGVITGSLIVFALAISSFITPELVGGGRVFLMATEIYNQAVGTLNWPVASAMAFILVTIFAGVLVVYQRLMRRLEW
jgi:putative spermidine/putrescine transport system permease protein